MEVFAKFLSRIFLIFLLIFSLNECNFKSKKEHPRKLDQENFVNLKIYIDYKNFDSDLSYETDKKEIFKQAINEAKSILEDLININIGNNNYIELEEDELVDAFNQYNEEDILNSEGNILINENKNYYVFFKFSDEINNDASAEIMFGIAGTPAMGLITFSKNISPNKITLKYLKTLMLHQFIHLLGFHPDVGSDFFSNIIDENNEITNVNILNYAKKYFNYNDIEKIKLEEDADGNLHWPSRLFLGELMSNLNYTDEQILSEFTLTFLSELSYLQVKKKYSGGLMKFGKHKGEEFYKNNCGDNIEDKITFANEFYLPTDTTNFPEPSCSSSRLSKTVYKLYSSEEEPSNAEYYLNQFTGLKFTNYCPIAKNEIPEDKDIYTGYYCSEETEVNRNDEINEELGENSFCVLSSLVKDDSSYESKFRAVCYKMICSAKSLTIKVGDNYIVCPRSGGQVKALNYKGYILCPDYNLICSGSSLCNNLYDCIAKESTEKESSFNYDYDIKATQDSKVYNSKNPIISYGWEEDDSTTETPTCPYLCSQCDSVKCINCAPHYKLDDNDNKKCIKKDSYCKKYEDDENDICIECFDSDNYFIAEENENNFICLAKTEENLLLYFQTTKKLKDDSNLIYYKRCYYGVEYCNKCLSNNQCTQCIEDNLELIDDGQICGDLTTKLYYLDNNTGKYKSCSSYDINCKLCEKDTNNNFKCLECNTCTKDSNNNEICNNFSFKHDNDITCSLKSSLKENALYYSDDEGNNYYLCSIYNDVNNCLECNNKESCLKCDENYLLNDDKKSCIKKEDIDNNLYFYNNDLNIFTKCSEVISQCNKCNDGSKCEECDSESGLTSDDTCVSNNLIQDKNFFYDNEIKKYINCNIIDNCVKCESNTECISCQSGYHINNNICQKNENDDDDDLSSGAIVGIVFGVLGFLLIAALTVYYLLKKFKKDVFEKNNVTEKVNNNNDNMGIVDNQESNNFNTIKNEDKNTKRSIHNI
jgi:hypothetical protein